MASSAPASGGRQRSTVSSPSTTKARQNPSSGAPTPMPSSQPGPADFRDYQPCPTDESNPFDLAWPTSTNERTCRCGMLRRDGLHPRDPSQRQPLQRPDVPSRDARRPRDHPPVGPHGCGDFVRWNLTRLRSLVSRSDYRSNPYPPLSLNQEGHWLIDQFLIWRYCAGHGCFWFYTENGITYTRLTGLSPPYRVLLVC
jgi:hypothetical protein